MALVLYLSSINYAALRAPTATTTTKPRAETAERVPEDKAFVVEGAAEGAAEGLAEGAAEGLAEGTAEGADVCCKPALRASTRGFG